jgi:hypothetical protein
MDVLIVMLVLQRLLEYRDKRMILKKLNMAIGEFFIEAGAELIKICSGLDPQLAALRQKLLVNKDCLDKEFSRGRKSAQEQHTSGIDSKRGNLDQAKDLLLSKRQFLLGLLENPNLL